MLLFITVIVAYCSIIYELLLSQTLAATLGNTVLRYNLTIGCYVAFLGFGVICYKKFNFSHLVKRLVSVEILLAIVGTLSPFVILLLDRGANLLADNLGVDYHGPLVQGMLYISNYSLVALIGFLSGFELPLLMDIGDKYHDKLSIKVLSSDYFGTMIGALLFPLILLPQLGIFTLAIATGLLNIVSAIMIYKLYGRDELGRGQIFASTAICAMLVALLFFRSGVEQFAINTLYL